MRYYWEVYSGDDYVGMTESFDVVTSIANEEPEAVKNERRAIAQQAREDSDGFLEVVYRLKSDLSDVA